MGEMTDEEILKWWSDHAPSLAPGTPTRTLAEMIDRTVSALREKVGKKSYSGVKNGWVGLSFLKFMEKWEPSDVARSIYRDAADKMEAELKKAEAPRGFSPDEVRDIEECLRSCGRLSARSSLYAADILKRARELGLWNFGFPK